MRAAPLLSSLPARSDIGRALAAHLCRCTGWQTVVEAVELAAGPVGSPAPERRLELAAQRTELEGGRQRVGPTIPLGEGGFADDAAPRDALVAIPRPPGSQVEAVEAKGVWWVVGDSLHEARTRATKVQGRRTTVAGEAPLPEVICPEGGVRLVTSWVEPAYLEPDASWCVPGGEPASPLANGGAFGGKVASTAVTAARELADRFGRAVRVVYAREDCVRLGPKRPPIAASAVVREGTLHLRGSVAVNGFGAEPFTGGPSPYDFTVEADWTPVPNPALPTWPALRAFPLAEHAVLVEGAIHESGHDRAALVRDERHAAVLLDSCVVERSGACAGARVDVDDVTGALERVEIRVNAGDPLDEVTLRSYATGAAHMALGWVLTEGITVDAETGEPLDLTIRSFGIIRAKDMPPVEVAIVDDPGPPLAHSSDAVFAAVAAATWNSVTRAEGARPERFPARDTRTSRLLRR